MIFKNPYWSVKLKISTLQRWIIVHSIIYYELNSSVVTDKVFDANAKQLVKMQNDNPKTSAQSDYWYVFNDFDGSTGFDLYHRLNKKGKQYLKHIAQVILNLYKAGGAR